MSESQHVEWKESWRDEYLKWVCGFANADGGVLIVGRNDEGEAVGIADARQLLETLPNKVRDLLGIIVDVNLVEEAGKQMLEIVVEPYPYPISYKGQYHYRTGSTKQELKGAALDQFLLKKQGKRWDGVPVPHVTADDLNAKTFDDFKAQAMKSKRVDEEVLGESNAHLLERLHLNDGAYLKRAAVLLFHPDPERFVTGAYVKIGYFASDDDLRYQDEVHGNLFEQVKGCLDLLRTKYMKAEIRYEGAQRIEEFSYPDAALREALLNAIAHKDYSGGTPIQISVYDNKMMFWNEGKLPEHWTIAQLSEKHPSKPHNPDIANAFFRAGLIESWGRGTLKILKACADAGLPVPTYKYDLSGFILEMPGKTRVETPGKTAQEKLGEKLGENEKGILELIAKNRFITIPELSTMLGISTTSVENNLAKLKVKKILKRIGPDKGGHWEIVDV